MSSVSIMQCMPSLVYIPLLSYESSIKLRLVQLAITGTSCIAAAPDPTASPHFQPAYDYGGLSREWFFLLSHEMFNPYYGLFEYSAM